MTHYQLYKKNSFIEKHLTNLTLENSWHAAKIILDITFTFCVCSNVKAGMQYKRGREIIAS